VDIDSAISFRTAQGTIGSLSILGSGPGGFMWEDMTISGANGCALFLRKDRIMASHGHGKGLVPVEDLGGHQGTNADDHFIEVIQGKAKNESPPEGFVEVIRFTQACWDSAAEGGRPIALA
jgi:hypothetical protein